jgi:hypothetical protein
MDLRVWLPPEGRVVKGVEEKKNVRLTERLSLLARSVCAFRLDSRHPPWRSSILPNLWPHYLQLSYKTLYVYRRLAAGITGILVNLDLRSEIFIFGVSLRLCRHKPRHCRDEKGYLH